MLGVKDMIFRETEFKLKDGRDALLRSPCEEDAEQMLQFIIKASEETESVRSSLTSLKETAGQGVFMRKWDSVLRE